MAILILVWLNSQNSDFHIKNLEVVFLNFFGFYACFIGQKEQRNVTKFMKTHKKSKLVNILNAPFWPQPHPTKYNPEDQSGHTGGGSNSRIFGNGTKVRDWIGCRNAYWNTIVIHATSKCIAYSWILHIC